MAAQPKRNIAKATETADTLSGKYFELTVHTWVRSAQGAIHRDETSAGLVAAAGAT